MHISTIIVLFACVALNAANITSSDSFSCEYNLIAVPRLVREDQHLRRFIRNGSISITSLKLQKDKFGRQSKVNALIHKILAKYEFLREKHEINELKQQIARLGPLVAEKALQTKLDCGAPYLSIFSPKIRTTTTRRTTTTTTRRTTTTTTTTTLPPTTTKPLRTVVSQSIMRCHNQTEPATGVRVVYLHGDCPCGTMTIFVKTVEPRIRVKGTKHFGSMISTGVSVGADGDFDVAEVIELPFSRHYTHVKQAELYFNDYRIRVQFD